MRGTIRRIPPGIMGLSNARQAQDEMTRKRQRQILAGKSTGDPIADFCIVNYVDDNYNDAEKRLREIDCLRPGSDVLIIEHETHPIMGHWKKYPHDPSFNAEFRRYGVLEDRVQWPARNDIKKGIVLPMKAYAWSLDISTCPKEWKPMKGSILLDPEEIKGGELYVTNRTDLPEEMAREWRTYTEQRHHAIEVITGDDLCRKFQEYTMLVEDHPNTPEDYPGSYGEARLCVLTGMNWKQWTQRQEKEIAAARKATMLQLYTAELEGRPEQFATDLLKDALVLDLHKDDFTAAYEPGVILKAPEYIIAQRRQHRTPSNRHH